MDQNIKNSAEKQIKKQHRRKIWKRIMMVLGSIVVFCTTYVLILPAITLSDKAYCGVEEHKHSDECYTHNLICKLDTESGSETTHKHSETCYETEKTLNCGQEESEGHTHDANCVETEKTLICVAAESEGHKHADACYAEDGSVICGQEESEGHKHGNSCYEEKQKTVCGKSESKGHTHSDSCWTEKETLICKQSETEQKKGHVHNEDCYEEVLKCELEEHTHKTACFSNPEADEETAADWEKTLPKELTGDWRKDVLLIAESQLGYKESRDNYIVDEDGKKKGYSRYGDWYGDKYGHWCAMFVSFCMDYAGVEGIPLDANCQNWIQGLKKFDLYRDASSYVPVKGDIIFFDWDLDGISHHVGLVAEVTLNEDGTVDKVKTIEGNSGNDCVEYNTYEGANPKIMGYGVLEKVDVEENDNTLIFENEQMSVTVVFPENYEIPEGAVLNIMPVNEETHGEAFTEITKAVEETVIKEDNMLLSKLTMYSSEMVVNDEVVEVPADLHTDFRVEFKESLYTKEEMETISELTVVSVEEPVQTYMLRGRSLEPTAYSVTELDANIEEIENGVTAIEAESEGKMPSFAVAAGTIVSEGNHWKRVDDLSELKKGDTILLVSIEGNIALTYGTNNNYETSVFLEQVKGHPEYYDVSVNPKGDELPAETKFQVTTTNNLDMFQLKCLGETNQNVRLGSTKDMFGTDQYDLKVEDVVETTTNVQNEKIYTWRIQNGNNGYLWYEAEGELIVSSTVRNDRRGFLILKLEDTKLALPKETIEEYVPPVIPDKPEYENVEPSGSKKDTTSDIEGLTKFKVQYASDPATSDIEDRFAGDISEDGKLLTDKSVIYMHDDYNSFTQYEEGQFGVTLSALGQVPSKNEGIGPALDVVIILDTSFSMLANNSGNVTRMEAAVDALNGVMGEILAQDLNRVGLVTFSDASQTVLPLDRYTTQDSVFIELTEDRYNTKNSYDDGHNRGGFLRDLKVNENVTNKQGVHFDDFMLDYALVKGNEKGGANWEGTFTQSGIQEAAELLLANNDTTYNGKARVPVIIMISDGGPTICSSNYKSPKSGPIYGNSGNNMNDGKYDYDTDAMKDRAGRANRLGINGYYTILTANYYKRLVGSHYDMKAKYLSIGIGIEESQTQTASGTHNHDNSYARAVLDPGIKNKPGANVDYAAQTENIYDYSYNNVINDFEAIQLKSLLNNEYNAKYVAVPNHYNGFNRLTVTHSRVPVLKNPYLNEEDSYDYADQYMDGNSENLKDILMDYVHSIQLVEYDWNYVLENETVVEFEDPLGDGMEVQSDLILHFGHDQYEPTEIVIDGNVATYLYEYEPIEHGEAYPKNIDADSKPENTVYDISRIQVTVTTVGEGLNKKQTVKMVVPEDLLPLMYSERYGKFYYQEHPIRLTYKVGLTEAAIQDARTMKAGESRTYYTNQWDTSGTPTTTAKFVHNDENDYNFELGDVAKTENTTETIGTSFITSDSGQNVTQYLGNNGRLVILKEATEVNVEKKWEGGKEDSVTVYLIADKEIIGDPVVLTEDIGWKHSWKGLPKFNAEDKEIVYSVSEKKIPGYETNILNQGTYKVGEWKTAESLEAGKKYILISAESVNKGSALTATDKDVFGFTAGVEGILNKNNPSDNVVWEAEQSGNYIYLKNSATGKYMNLVNIGSVWNTDYVIQLQSSRTAVRYSDGKLRVGSSRYFSGLNSDSYGSTSNLYGAYNFILYAYETDDQEIPADTWFVVNKKIEEDLLPITIKKKDNFDTPLTGAKFALYRASEGEEGEVNIPYSENLKGILIDVNLVVDENGEVPVELSDTAATYYLVEMVAPEGFDRLETPIKFQVIEGTEGSYIKEADDADNDMASITDNTITVINEAGYVLPHTGGTGTTMYILGGAMLMLSAILIFIKRFFERRYI